NLASRLNSYALSYPWGFKILGLMFLKEKYDSTFNDQDKELMRILVSFFEKETFRQLEAFSYKNEMRMYGTEWFQASFDVVKRTWEHIQSTFHYFLEKPQMEFYREL